MEKPRELITNATHAGKRVRVEGGTYTSGSHTTQSGRVLTYNSANLADAGWDARGDFGPGDVVVVLDNGAIVKPHRHWLTLLD